METSRRLIAAPRTAALMRYALSDGGGDRAARWLVETVSRLIQSTGEDVGPEIFGKPESTGSEKYDTVLAAAFSYAATICHHEPPSWTDRPPLSEPWLFGGDGFESEQYMNLVRRETPVEFSRVNVLCRPRDWVSW